MKVLLGKVHLDRLHDLPWKKVEIPIHILDLAKRK